MRRSLMLLLLSATLACQGRNPSDPVQFEVSQTEKFLGFAVRPFPEPQGTGSFDELPADSPKFDFQVSAKKLSGPGVAPSDRQNKSVFVKAPNATVVEAYLGSPKEAGIAKNQFTSTPDNRRNAYGGGAYHPYDVLIGPRVDGQLVPKLFFRDVGSHANAPHAMAIDDKGRCHLMITDVDMGQRNRLKVHWLIGNLDSGKWTEAHLIDHRKHFTSWARPWAVAWRDRVHLVWNWADVSRPGKHEESGIYHVEWSPKGFGRKTKVFRGVAESIDVAVDPDSGRLLVVASSDDGVFVSAKAPDGKWSLPTSLHPELRQHHEVSIEAKDHGAFAVRTGTRIAGEWLVQPGDENPGKKAGAAIVRQWGLAADALPQGAVARLGSLKLMHDSECRSLDFSPDGTMLATGTSFGDVFVWDLPSGKQLAMMRAHSHRVSKLQFSKDSKLLLSAGGRKVSLWNVADGKPVREWKVKNYVEDVAFRNADRNVIATTESGDIVTWDTSSGKQLSNTDGASRLTTYRISPKGDRILSHEFEKPTIELWEVGKQDSAKEIRCDKEGAHSLAFSGDGRLLVFTGIDEAVRIVNVHSGEEIARLKIGERQNSPERFLISAAISFDGSTVAVFGRNQDITLWNRETGKKIRSLGPARFVPAAAFSRDGRYFAASDENRMRIWEVSSGKELRSDGGNRGWIHAVAFSPDDQQVATARADKRLRLWDAKKQAVTRVLIHESEGPLSHFIRTARKSQQRVAKTVCIYGR